ncbi:MAG: sulfite exporter TauE/SafE family protein [Pseudobutyrivibrio sp.]|nr:sulfite exporter TauE/SafE family protein [Pseudobutyrivibrio sp.]
MELKHKVLVVDGMTCINCQQKIESKLSKTKGIKRVRVSYNRGTADVTYDPSKLSVKQITRIIEQLGYSVSDKQTATFNFERTIATISVIILLYVLLQRFGVLNLLVPSQLADSSMSYGMLFVVGLLTSVHCVSMCGGINLSQSITAETGSKAIWPSLMYNAGRVVSYTVIGFILGGIGMLITGQDGVGLSTGFQGVLKIIAGVLMVIMGINMLNIFPWMRYLQIRLPKKLVVFITKKRLTARRPFIIGLLNGLMPCGPMQSMQIIALGSGNPIVGAVSMFVFSIGTVPLMLGLGTIVSALGKKYTKAVMYAGSVLVAVLGLVMISQGFNLSGVSATSVNQVAAIETQEAPEENEAADDSSSLLNTAILSEDGAYQEVQSNLELGYYPEITVYSGVPVKWTINADERSITGCNYRMILNQYGLSHDFVPGENVIEFTPGDVGTVDYTCWMGMISGRINVIDGGQNV